MVWARPLQLLPRIWSAAAASSTAAAPCFSVLLPSVLALRPSIALETNPAEHRARLHTTHLPKMSLRAAPQVRCGRAPEGQQPRLRGGQVLHGVQSTQPKVYCPAWLPFLLLLLRMRWMARPLLHNSGGSLLVGRRSQSRIDGWDAVRFAWGFSGTGFCGQTILLQFLTNSLHMANTTPPTHSSACGCCCCAAGLACLRMLGTSPALEMVNCLRASLSSFVAWIFLATASIRRCITTGVAGNRDARHRQHTQTHTGQAADTKALPLSTCPFSHQRRPGSRPIL